MTLFVILVFLTIVQNRSDYFLPKSKCLRRAWVSQLNQEHKFLDGGDCVCFNGNVAPDCHAKLSRAHHYFWAHHLLLHVSSILSSSEPKSYGITCLHTWELAAAFIATPTSSTDLVGKPLTASRNCCSSLRSESSCYKSCCYDSKCVLSQRIYK